MIISSDSWFPYGQAFHCIAEGMGGIIQKKLFLPPSLTKSPPPHPTKIKYSRVDWRLMGKHILYHSILHETVFFSKLLNSYHFFMIMNKKKKKMSLLLFALAKWLGRVLMSADQLGNSGSTLLWKMVKSLVGASLCWQSEGGQT